MRIRTLLLWCFALVALPGAAGLSWQAGQAWSASRDAQRAALSTRILSEALRAATTLAVESGLLGAAARTGRADEAALRMAAEATDAALGRTRTLALAGHVAAEPLDEARERMSGLRNAVQAALRDAPGRPDLALASGVREGRAEAMERIDRLAHVAEVRISAASPGIALLGLVARQVMSVRDDAGSRSLLINGWLANQPVTAEAVAGAEGLGGQIDQAWKTARLTIEALGNQALAEAAAALEGDFFRTAEPRYRAFVAAARAPLAAPAAPPAWPGDGAGYADWTVATLARLAPLRDLALDEAVALGDRLAADALALMLASVALAAAAALLALSGAWLLLRRLVAPMRALTLGVGRIAEGELDTAVPHGDRADEIGAMARAVEVLRRGSLERQRMQAEAAAAQEERVRRARRLEALVHDFEGRVGQTSGILSSASAELEATARSMTETAGNTSRQAGLVTGAAEEANSGVQTVASAAEELAASIREIGRQLAEATAMSSRAVENARRTDHTVRTLQDGAQQIGDVVRLISDIAGQTNLLALNATIEAARAGDAGKGFAVVASEVKSLAGQTAQATGQIGDQIAQIRSATEAAVQAIQDISASITEVSGIAVAIAAAVEQQSAATGEIARSVQHTAGATGSVSSHIAAVGQGSHETGAAATQVLAAAGDLARQAERLRADVGDFVGQVRAA